MYRRIMHREQMRKRHGANDYSHEHYQPDYGMGSQPHRELGYAHYGEYAMRDGYYPSNYSVPFEVAGRYGNRQYRIPEYHEEHHEPDYLSEHELREWTERLLHSVEAPYKAMFEKERVLKRADELGMRYEKYTKDEFYVTVLMLYTDFCKTLGSNNVDMYLKLAKDWLCDDDIAIKHSEKLAVYHDEIVEGM